MVVHAGYTAFAQRKELVKAEGMPGIITRAR
jgi:hypothetical protein